MISANLEDVRRRIELACKRTGRRPEEITLLAVTKGRSPEEIKEAIKCGISDIGENRLQEALPKYNELRTTAWAIGSPTAAFWPAGDACLPARQGRRINWHMIGHLQTNKVKEAVRIFDLIQSVDSLRLGQAISKEAGKINKQQDILLEVKTSPEESKFGLKPEDTLAVFQEISRLPNLSVKGLMTIAPFTDNPEESRPYFKMLKELSEQTFGHPTGVQRVLSMGMSGDFETAIEEGSTMVRLGRVIFQ